jgi:hypothetical protein
MGDAQVELTCFNEHSITKKSYFVRYQKIQIVCLKNVAISKYRMYSLARRPMHVREDSLYSTNQVIIGRRVFIFLLLYCYHLCTLIVRKLTP